MAKVFDLPVVERNLPSVVTEENLIKVKMLPEEVGTKVGWKKFIDGRAVGEKLKGTKRKRSESCDSESDNEEGRALARLHRRARPLPHLLLSCCILIHTPLASCICIIALYSNVLLVQFYDKFGRALIEAWPSSLYRTLTLISVLCRYATSSLS